MKPATIFLLAIGLAVAAAQATTNKPVETKPAESNKPAEAKPAVHQPLKEGGSVTHDDQVPLWKLSEDQLRFHPTDPIRGSVLTSTKLMLDAFLAREPGTAMLHFSPRTRIVYHSATPAGGVYRGWLGLLDFIARCKLAFHLEKFEYTIPYVDEARGFSVVRIKYGGKFIRTGKELQTSKTVYCKWRFGRLHKCYLVDDDPAAVMQAYFTPAEMVIGKFYEDLFTCGDCASKYLSDNFQSTVHMFPKSLAEKFSYKGVDEFKKRMGTENASLMLDQIKNIRFLYGSNDTVIVLTKYGTHMSAIPEIGHAIGSRIGGRESGGRSLRDLASVSIVKVKDGKIDSIKAQLNQPLAPWTVRQLGLLAKEKAAIAHVVKSSKGAKILGKEAKEGEQKPVAGSTNVNTGEQQKAKEEKKP